MRLATLLLFAAGIAACSDSNGCAPTGPCVAQRSTADSVAGAWSEVQTWTGRSIHMSLAARDTTLFGSGTYSDTTGRAGSAQISGYVFWQDSVFVPSGHMEPAHPVVVLHISFSDGTSAVFDQATIQQHTTLYGVLTFSTNGSASYGTAFVRATQ